MFTASIKISELDPLSVIANNDFFPLVQSSSLTTFRANFNTLGTWIGNNVNVLSASWASSSISSSYSLTSSYSLKTLSSSYALSASYAPFSQSYQVSSSYSLTSSFSPRSLSSSYALSASYAPFSQSYQVSSSYALSASYSPFVGDTLAIGSIISFVGPIIPNNWLECNGAAVLTSSYNDLYLAIKTLDTGSMYGYLCDSFGNRNSSGSYFKIPDFRGEFLRGWDHSRGVDIGRGTGSFQSDGIKLHTHIVLGGAAGSFQQGGAYGASDGTNNVNSGNTGNNTSGITETRPRNIAVMFCIKYSNAVNLANLTGVTLAGDVVGNYNTTTVTKIQSIPVSGIVPPTNGQVLTYNAGQWAPADPSLAVNAAYPNIQSITFTSINDDYVDIDMSGLRTTSVGSGLTAGFSNNTYNNGNISGVPTSTYVSRSINFDWSNGVYDVSSNNSITQLVGCQPVQNCLMFSDNRGGSYYYWFMYGPLVVKFNLSSTSVATHTYQVNTGTNYAGQYLRISAMRAGLGLNAILNDNSLETGTISFPLTLVSIT